MHPTARAVEAYHDILRQCDAAALWQGFQEQMRARRLFFGDRAVCNVLRPHFLHPEEFAVIVQATEAVLGAIHKVYQALRSGELDAQKWLALSPAEAALLTLPDLYGPPDVSARMDAFWLPGPELRTGELYFLEYNADSPGGLGYGDVLSELFLAWAPMQRFAETYQVESMPVRSHIHHTLRAVYQTWCGRVGRPPVARPTIAIVDWRGVRTFSEFLLIGEVFEGEGSRVVICDPDDLRLEDGRLRTPDDQAIDIVYKRVVVNEFLRRYPEPDALLAHPLVRAVVEKQVCIANQFGCQFLYNKAIFALISDEENWHRFSAEEQQAIARHVPWTRLVTDGRTRRDGRWVALVPWLRQHRASLVLKPVREYGGSGVVLGWEVDQAGWEQAIQRALAEPYIVQERVPTPRAVFPVWQDGAVHFLPRMVDVDPYVWQGRTVAHAGVRLGASALLNVSAGGGSAAPLFLVREKDSAT